MENSFTKSKKCNVFYQERRQSFLMLVTSYIEVILVYKCDISSYFIGIHLYMCYFGWRPYSFFVNSVLR